jgi:hypothetical protein
MTMLGNACLTALLGVVARLWLPVTATLVGNALRHVMALMLRGSRSGDLSAPGETHGEHGGEQDPHCTVAPHMADRLCRSSSHLSTLT